ncbi:hypothetical protein GCM10010468_22460 [Actinocorallia longicatena]|uniref:Uncharacterized protein n=1 Tax=Actinocorallia longicatena TaxID=111803 RepID=A0ABP6Q6R7_9ACTN
MSMRRVDRTGPRPVPADTPPEEERRPARWVSLEAEPPSQGPDRANGEIDG